MKRHLMAISGRVDDGISIPSPHQLTKKTLSELGPSDKTFWIRALGLCTCVWSSFSDVVISEVGKAKNGKVGSNFAAAKTVKLAATVKNGKVGSNFTAAKKRPGKQQFCCSEKR